MRRREPVSIDVIRYEDRHREAWDRFVATAKNGVFLFLRDYMDYHASRFADHSLLFFAGGRLVAVLPATVQGARLISHGGLTFGGVVSGGEMRTPLMLSIFATMRAYLRSAGIATVLYKTIPQIYHRKLSQEDLYALFVGNARLCRRDLSSTIDLRGALAFSKGRRWAANLARRNELVVRRSWDFDLFMAIEESLLAGKYGVRPAHTAAEMKLLASRFPENIKLFCAYRGEAMLGGTVIYESERVAHAQYIAATDEGKEKGALDLVLTSLVRDYAATKHYFDFGISTDHEGRYLNEGLVANKESFGAGATVYDFYELDLGDGDHATALENSDGGGGS